MNEEHERFWRNRQARAVLDEWRTDEEIGATEPYDWEEGTPGSEAKDWKRRTHGDPTPSEDAWAEHTPAERARHAGPAHTRRIDTT